MKKRQELMGKVALIVWSIYANNCKEDFVLDEEEDLDLLDLCFSKMQELDTDISIYACTYNIDEKSVYCDNVWVKTHLTIKQIEDIFSKYRSIEPYLIDSLADEKDDVDVFIDTDGNYSEFKSVADEFDKDNTISLFWD